MYTIPEHCLEHSVEDNPILSLQKLLSYTFKLVLITLKIKSWNP